LWLALWEVNSVLYICPLFCRPYFGGYFIVLIARSIYPAPLPSDNKSTMEPGFAVVGTPGSPSDVARTKVLLPRLLGGSARFIVRLRSVVTHWSVNKSHEYHRWWGRRRSVLRSWRCVMSRNAPEPSRSRPRFQHKRLTRISTRVPTLFRLPFPACSRGLVRCTCHCHRFEKQDSRTIPYQACAEDLAFKTSGDSSIVKPSTECGAEQRRNTTNAWITGRAAHKKDGSNADAKLI